MIAPKEKGIIFDMDNTILRSNIDFKRMKLQVHAYLVGHHIVSESIALDEFTSSTLIELARSSPRFTAQAEQAVWDIVTELEREGMNDAGLEPGVEEVLEQLRPACHLTILTNNAKDAAVRALRTTGIEHYFEHIVGREQAGLKPSPAGVQWIVNSYPHVSKQHWLAIGDAWIDGKSAIDAGVRFIAYQANRSELERRGVVPTAYIESMADVIQYI
ncbi:HAD family hydrolase [Paenibacillus allorhizosphaerae]|uniref:Phosphoglycolate phosphatase n=1 Tax=Paenibacillus allorhizosphaerae TaxID=2849866 RepID=A0ABM8VB33_9BACL|nr:HAD-IA family hydrolase [Paenibacillus allorhizosphaerae]CAG7618283.1 Phosphoglycolate phosphatase [Paenibacillus allorhizosphaerae]